VLFLSLLNSSHRALSGAAFFPREFHHNTSNYDAAASAQIFQTAAMEVATALTLVA
jgi:hypothetical protein